MRNELTNSSWFFPSINKFSKSSKLSSVIGNLNVFHDCSETLGMTDDANLLVLDSVWFLFRLCNMTCVLPEKLTEKSSNNKIDENTRKEKLLSIIRSTKSAILAIMSIEARRAITVHTGAKQDEYILLWRYPVSILMNKKGFIAICKYIGTHYAGWYFDAECTAYI